MTLPLAETKAALIDFLTPVLRATYPTLQVDYAQRTDVARRRSVWVGDIEDGDANPTAIKAPSPRRDGTFTIPLVILVSDHPDPRKTDTDAEAIGSLVEETLATNPKLDPDAPVPGLLWVVVAGKNLTTGLTGEGAASTLTINLSARLRST